MEIQDQVHLKGRVWSPVSYSLEECFDTQAAAERIFPPGVWEKATLGASASSRKTTRKKSLLYLQANQAEDIWCLLDFVTAGWETQVATAGTGAPKVGPIVLEHPSLSSRVCSNISTYNCVSKDGAYEYRFGYQLLSTHSLTDCSNLIL